MAFKNIFIISASKIYKGNSASSSRLMNVAKALALANDKIYLCSSEYNKYVDLANIKEIELNVFLVGSDANTTRELNKISIKKFFYKLTYLISIISYLRKISLIMEKTEGEKIIYLYPGIYISIEIICLILFKLFNHFKIYYDLNEMRRAGLYNKTYSEMLIKKLIQKSIFFINWLKYYLNEKMLVFYDGLIVISTNLENYSKKYNENLLRIPILSNTQFKSFTRAPFLGNNQSFLICFTGLIILKKEGFDLLLEVISKVNQHYCTELHLFGTIANHEKDLILNILPEKFGISGKIKYFGMIDQENLISEMQRRHLLILPRPLNLQTKYGFSTKLSEYLTSGVPTLVTDVSDNYIYIKDNINGFIVKPGDPDKMVNKILFIIENYNKIVVGIVENAYKTAFNYFNYIQFVEQLDGFLQ